MSEFSHSQKGERWFFPDASNKSGDAERPRRPSSFRHIKKWIERAGLSAVLLSGLQETTAAEAPGQSTAPPEVSEQVIGAQESAPEISPEIANAFEAIKEQARRDCVIEDDGYRFFLQSAGSAEIATLEILGAVRYTLSRVIKDAEQRRQELFEQLKAEHVAIDEPYPLVTNDALSRLSSVIRELPSFPTSDRPMTLSLDETDRIVVENNPQAGYVMHIPRSDVFHFAEPDAVLRELSYAERGAIDMSPTEKDRLFVWYNEVSNKLSQQNFGSRIHEDQERRMKTKYTEQTDQAKRKSREYLEKARGLNKTEPEGERMTDEDFRAAEGFIRYHF